MDEYKYMVMMDGEPIADGMTLNNALVLAEALFKRHNINDLSVTICRYSGKFTVAEQYAEKETLKYE